MNLSIHTPYDWPDPVDTIPSPLAKRGQPAPTALDTWAEASASSFCVDTNALMVASVVSLRLYWIVRWRLADCRARICRFGPRFIGALVCRMRAYRNPISYSGRTTQWVKPNDVYHDRASLMPLLNVDAQPNGDASALSNIWLVMRRPISFAYLLAINDEIVSGRLIPPQAYWRWQGVDGDGQNITAYCVNLRLPCTHDPYISAGSYCSIALTDDISSDVFVPSPGFLKRDLIWMVMHLLTGALNADVWDRLAIRFPRWGMPTVYLSD